MDSEPAINRFIEEKLIRKIRPNKVTILIGARRVGKSTLIKNITNRLNDQVLLLNGEDHSVSEVLKIRTVENYKRLIGTHSTLIIDEAQQVPEIGLALKLMVDEIPGIKILATGSSQFELFNELGEPLTGRSITQFLFPIAQMELSPGENLAQTRARLEERLIYGSYPEIWQYKENSEKEEYLKNLVSNYLFRDILAYEGIRNSSKLIDLLRLVAFQTGQEVAMDELGQQLGMGKNTVERYLDLLSKVFIIYRLKALSRNPRKEISKSSKWYFYDNGIRNTLIANFNPLSLRNDQGILWENYLLSERIKYQNYTDKLVNNYFWRTYQQQEIDWVEEREGNLFAFEVKWNPDKKTKAPSAWRNSYSDATYETISRDNYLSWIGA